MTGSTAASPRRRYAGLGRRKLASASGEQYPRNLNGRALVRLLWVYLRVHRGRVAVLGILQIAQTIATLYLPTVNADIIDNGVLKGNTEYILALGRTMVAVTVLQVLCMAGVIYLGTRMALAVSRDIRSDLFAHVLTFSSREIAHYGTSSLTTRTTNDVQQIQQFVQRFFTMLVSAPLMCVGGVGFALGLDVPLAMLLLGIVPLLSILMALIVRRMRPLFLLMQERIDTVNRILREQINGVRVIRAFRRDVYEQERFTRANEGLTDVSVRAGRLSTLMFPLAVTVVNVFSIPMVWLGARRIEMGETQIGALTAFLGYLTLILMAVSTATLTLMMAPRAEVCAGRIAELLHSESTITPPSSPIRRLSGPVQVELRGVEFRYPGAEDAVLRGVDLTARRGETTAIVGSTGSGKTTLFGLIPRLADPTSGEVLLGGQDVRCLDPSLLVRTVGMVPQTAYLFDGTVASNLRLGRDSASDRELWHALEVAQARDFVERLDGGLDARITQGGMNVSGGQRQRLAIARVLVHGPEIFLFDDSFSALDYATEAALRAALARELAGATVLTIAQRVSTIRDADNIVVLDAGRVVKSGTHDELLRTCSAYQELVLSQGDEEAGQMLGGAS